MSRALVSACLIGRACRYDGGDELRPELVNRLAAQGVEAVPFCPEEAGGLGTPRPAARLTGGDGRAVAEGRARVVTADGADVTTAFIAGALLAVTRACAEGCTAAYLKERSPSCGCVQVHTEEGVVPGCGVTTALLRRAGIETFPIA